MKKKVLLRAPLLTVSGYGVHSRQIFKWLKKKSNIDLYTQIVPWGNTSWMISDDCEGGIIGDILASSSGQLDFIPDVALQVQLPNEWTPRLGKKTIGVSAFVETNICNPEWLNACNQMDHVIVPSKHVYTTITNTGIVNVPVGIVHESYFEEIDAEKLPDLTGNIKLETSFNFLMIGQMTAGNPKLDRKNLFFTLKWLCEVFKNDPEVGIILKTNSGRGTTIDRSHTTHLLKSYIDTIRSGPFPRIYLVHGNMDNHEVASLYRHPTVKGFVSLTRGEGFGLPLLEAAASDLPVIATNWSGHLDFLRHGKFIPVDYNLSYIPSEKVDGNIFVEGSKWAEPSEIDFKRKVKKFREKPELPCKWACEMGQKIRTEFSQNAVENQYNEVLGSYL